MAKARFGTYDLNANDADLQTVPTKLAPDPPAPPSAADFVPKIKLATKKAVELAQVSTEGDIAIKKAMFSVSRTAKNAGNKAIPVEWIATDIPGKKKVGSRAKDFGMDEATPLYLWTVMIDMDDIPAKAIPNGPDRPHVGWMTFAKSNLPTAAGKDKATGHVFVDNVPASRHGKEDSAAAKGTALGEMFDAPA